MRDGGTSHFKISFQHFKNISPIGDQRIDTRPHRQVYGRKEACTILIIMEAAKETH